MPICSYVVYPAPGKYKELTKQLNQIKECETRMSTNEDILILVTDTRDEKHEKELQKRLEKMETIQCLAMAFAHIEDPLYKEAN